MASRLSSGTTLRKEGYLYKSGDHLRWNLKKRYVIWRYPHLQWFYSETDSSPSGTIDIYEVTSLTLTGGLISITTPTGPVDFKAENAEVCNVLYDTGTYKGNQAMIFASGAVPRGLMSTVGVDRKSVV